MTDNKTATLLFRMIAESVSLQAHTEKGIKGFNALSKAAREGRAQLLLNDGVTQDYGKSLIVIDNESRALVKTTGRQVELWNDSGRALQKNTEISKKHSDALLSISDSLGEVASSIAKVNFNRITEPLLDAYKKAKDFSLIMGTVAVGMTATNVIIGNNLLKSYAELNDEMSNVNSVLLETPKNLKSLSEDVRDLSLSLKLATETEIATGLYDVASAGFTGAAGITVLDTAIKTSKAGRTELRASSALIAQTLNAMGLAATDSGYAANVLFKTVQRGVLEFKDLANGSGQILAKLNSLKQPLEVMGAALSLETRKGMTPEKAFTNLNSLLVSFSAQSVESRKKATELGIQMDANAVKTKGFAQVLEAVIDAAKKTGDLEGTLFKLLGRQEAVDAALVLSNAAEFKNELKEFADSSDALSDSLTAASDNINTKFDNIKVGLSAIKTEAGGLIAEFAGNFIPVVQKVTDDFNSLSEGARNTILTFAGIIAMIPVVVVGFGAITLGIGLLILQLIATRVVLGLILNYLKPLIQLLIMLTTVVKNAALAMWGFVTGTNAGSAALATLKTTLLATVGAVAAWTAILGSAAIAAVLLTKAVLDLDKAQEEQRKNEDRNYKTSDKAVKTISGLRAKEKRGEKLTASEQESYAHSLVSTYGTNKILRDEANRRMAIAKELYEEEKKLANQKKGLTDQEKKDRKDFLDKVEDAEAKATKSRYENTVRDAAKRKEDLLSELQSNITLNKIKKEEEEGIKKQIENAYQGELKTAREERDKEKNEKIKRDKEKAIQEQKRKDEEYLKFSKDLDDKIAKNKLSAVDYELREIEKKRKEALSKARTNKDKTGINFVFDAEKKKVIDASLKTEKEANQKRLDDNLKTFNAIDKRFNESIENKIRKDEFAREEALKTIRERVFYENWANEIMKQIDYEEAQGMEKKMKRYEDDAILLQNIAEAEKKSGQDILEGINNTGVALENLGDIFTANENAAGKFISKIGELTSSAVGMIKSLAEGDLIGASLNMISTVFEGIMDHFKQVNKEAERSTDSLISLNKEIRRSGGLTPDEKKQNLKEDRDRELRELAQEFKSEYGDNLTADIETVWGRLDYLAHRGLTSLKNKLLEIEKKYQNDIEEIDKDIADKKDEGAKKETEKKMKNKELLISAEYDLQKSILDLKEDSLQKSLDKITLETNYKLALLNEELIAEGLSQEVMNKRYETIMNVHNAALALASKTWSDKTVKLNKDKASKIQAYNEKAYNEEYQLIERTLGKERQALESNYNQQLDIIKNYQAKKDEIISGRKEERAEKIRQAGLLNSDISKISKNLDAGFYRDNQLSFDTKDQAALNKLEDDYNSGKISFEQKIAKIRELAAKRIIYLQFQLAQNQKSTAAIKLALEQKITAAKLEYSNAVDKDMIALDKEKANAIRKRDSLAIELRIAREMEESEIKKLDAAYKTSGGVFKTELVNSTDYWILYTKKGISELGSDFFHQIQKSVDDLQKAKNEIDGSTGSTSGTTGDKRIVQRIPLPGGAEMLVYSDGSTGLTGGTPTGSTGTNTFNALKGVQYQNSTTSTSSNDTLRSATGTWDPVTGKITSGLQSYAEGTNYVPQTGLYKLHVGESVRTAKQTKEDRVGSNSNIAIYQGDIIINCPTKPDNSLISTIRSEIKAANKETLYKVRSPI